MLWLTILNSITLLDLLALVIMTGVQIALHLREPPLITTLLLLGGVGRLALLAWSLLKESRLSLTLLSIYSTLALLGLAIYLLITLSKRIPLPLLLTPLLVTNATFSLIYALLISYLELERVDLFPVSVVIPSRGLEHQPSSPLLFSSSQLQPGGYGTAGANQIYGVSPVSLIKTPDGLTATHALPDLVTEVPVYQMEPPVRVTFHSQTFMPPSAFTQHAGDVQVEPGFMISESPLQSPTRRPSAPQFILNVSTNTPGSFSSSAGSGQRLQIPVRQTYASSESGMSAHDEEEDDEAPAPLFQLPSYEQQVGRHRRSTDDQSSSPESHKRSFLMPSLGQRSRSSSEASEAEVAKKGQEPCRCNSLHCVYKDICFGEIWAFDVAAVEATFKQSGVSFPRWTLLKAEWHLIVFLLTQEKVQKEEAWAYAESVEIMSSKLLESDRLMAEHVNRRRSFRMHIPGTVTGEADDVLLAKAESLIIRTGIQLISGELELKSAFNVRKAWKVLSELQKRNLSEELRISVMFCRGLFDYLFSMIPGNVSSLLKTIGFVPSLEKGVLLLKTVAESDDCLKAPWAALILLYDLLLMPSSSIPVLNKDISYAQTLLQRFTNKYPNNPIFVFMQSQLERKSFVTFSPSACRALDLVTQAKLNTDNMQAEIAYLYLTVLDPNTAEPLFRKAYLGQGRPRDNDLRYFAGILFLACRNWRKKSFMDDDTMTLIKEIKRALLGENAGKMFATPNRKLCRFQKFALYQCIRALERNWISPLLIPTVLYLRRDAAHMSISQLRNLEAFVLEAAQIITEDVEMKAVLHFFKGFFLDRLHGDLPGALQILQETSELCTKVKLERWILPYSKFEQGILHWRLGQTTLAVQMLDQVVQLTKVTVKLFTSSGHSDVKGKFEFSDHLRKKATLTRDYLLRHPAL